VLDGSPWRLVLWAVEACSVGHGGLLGGPRRLARWATESCSMDGGLLHGPRHARGNYDKLEIKPCGLGSRIRDTEGESEISFLGK